MEKGVSARKEEGLQIWDFSLDQSLGSSDC